LACKWIPAFAGMTLIAFWQNYLNEFYGLKMKYYPMFIDIRDKLVLVVGEYRVLDFKMQKLLEAGAKIKYISEFFPENLKSEIEKGRGEYLSVNYDPKYLDDAWLVIVGSEDDELKARIKSDTDQRKIYTNFVDEAPISSFISPTVISKGDITIAISTKGKSPALNRKLKKMISEAIGDEYVKLADLLGSIRPKVIKNIAGQKQRAELFERILEDRNLLKLVKNNQIDEARSYLDHFVDQTINLH